MSDLGETFTEAARAMREFTLAMLACGVTGEPNPHPEGAPPAEYIWTHDVPLVLEHETPLCAACCAKWRADAERIPELPTPRRIRSVPRSTLFTAAEGSDPDDPQAWTPMGTVGPLTIEWNLPTSP